MKNNELILRAETRADWDEVEFLTLSLIHI